MLTSNKHRQDAKEIERMIMNQHDWRPGQYVDRFGKPYHMEGTQRLYYYTGNGERVTCLKCGTVLPYMTSDFKPGDVQPDGYMEFFDWAEVQHKAGLRQVRRACGLWHFPQETCEHEGD